MKTLYYQIFYQLAWFEKERGYYVHKRWWVWLLLFPLLLPFLLLKGFGNELELFIGSLSKYRAFYIKHDSRPEKWKVSRKQRNAYKKHLLS